MKSYYVNNELTGSSNVEITLPETPRIGDFIVHSHVMLGKKLEVTSIEYTIDKKYITINVK